MLARLLLYFGLGTPSQPREGTAPIRRRQTLNVLADMLIVLLVFYLYAFLAR